MNIRYNNALTEVQGRTDFELTEDTPYLTLMSELWGVYCEHFDLGEHGLYYKSTELYWVTIAPL